MPSLPFGAYQGVAISGFAELQRAFERVEGGRGNYGVEWELQKQQAAVGEKVAAAAPRFVTHKTGRHADPGQPRLEDSVKVSVTKNAAAVYSTAIFGGIQNQGGGPHAGWTARGPHVKRENASRWMDKAVLSQQQQIKDEVDSVLDWAVAEVDRRF